jgi:hypothetical protein
MTSGPRHETHVPEDAPEELHWFFDYWDSKRPSEGANPRRSDIDPSDFPKLLNTTFIVQRMQDGRHKMRLAGTYYHHLYGREITGAYVEDLMPLNSAGKALGYAHSECARTNGPVYTESSAMLPNSESAVVFKRLLLPLAGPQQQIEFMIGTAIFFNEDGPRIDTANWSTG